MGTTIKLKGPGLNDWFAEQLVKDCGPDAAREKTCGPSLESVERVIARMERTKLAASTPKEQP